MPLMHVTPDHEGHRVGHAQEGLQHRPIRPRRQPATVDDDAHPMAALARLEQAVHDPSRRLRRDAALTGAAEQAQVASMHHSRQQRLQLDHAARSGQLWPPHPVRPLEATHQIQTR